jgi:hypothetical protein
MTTALITDCFTGLVRVVGMLLFVIISAESIYFLLFSETPVVARESYLSNPNRFKLLFSRASNDAKENSVCNPYRFKNASKLTALAVGFIFFIRHRDQFAICGCKNHSSSVNNFSNSEINYSSIYPGNYHSSTLRRHEVKPKLFANGAMQNLTTCL